MRINIFGRMCVYHVLSGWGGLCMIVSLWAFVFVTCDSVGGSVTAGCAHQREGRASQPFLIVAARGRLGKR